MPGYQPMVVIARPPRPGVVNIAVILTYLGAGLALVGTVITIISNYLDRSEITSQLNGGLQDERVSAVQIHVLAHAAFGIAVAIAILMWVIPAAGAVVTAALSSRGNNPARITLTCLMGVYALFGVCNGISGLVSAGMQDATRPSLDIASAAIAVVVAGVAVAVGVLVLLPSANRFFSAGPGRRFAPST
jgi:hypothetical protein